MSATIPRTRTENKPIAEWRADGAKWLDEVLRDALNSPRLSESEERFICDLNRKLRRFRGRMDLSSGQMKWLLAIEQKIHKAG